MLFHIFKNIPENTFGHLRKINCNRITFTYLGLYMVKAATRITHSSMHMDVVFSVSEHQMTRFDHIELLYVNVDQSPITVSWKKVRNYF